MRRARLGLAQGQGQCVWPPALLTIGKAAIGSLAPLDLSGVVLALIYNRVMLGRSDDNERQKRLAQH